MEKWITMAHRYLQQTATIHVYSFPNFILESFISLIILVIYILLHVDLNKFMRRYIRVTTNAVYCDTSAGAFSENSSQVAEYRGKFCTQTYIKKAALTGYSGAFKRLHRKKGTELHNANWLQLPDESLPTTGQGNYEPLFFPDNRYRQQYIKQFLELTPQQFVKLDRDKKLHEMNDAIYRTSLATLCKNMVDKKFSDNTLVHQVDFAKESLCCDRLSSAQGKYMQLKRASLTDSLLTMLEEMIRSSSLQKPIPFKGDITTLALDAANLLTSDDDDDEQRDSFSTAQSNDSTSSLIIMTTATDDDTASISMSDVSPYNNRRATRKRHTKVPIEAC